MDEKWYSKLSTYFPDHEMKHEGQMEDLVMHHEAYRVYHTDEVVVSYAEFSTFLFIDYLLVNPKTRGRGTGSKTLDMFKQRGKTIILEVEPPDTDAAETVNRVRFYERNGFRKAEHIEYTRSDDEGTPFTMDVYYWPAKAVDERLILEQMAIVCREIHNFRSLKYYGRVLADPDDSLNWVH